MDRYKKVKHWVVTSDWKIWLVGGVVVIFLASYVQDAVMESRVNQIHNSIMSSIDREEERISHSKEEAEKMDHEVDSRFSKAFKSSQEMIDKAWEKMDTTKKEFGQK